MTLQDHIDLLAKAEATDMYTAVSATNASLSTTDARSYGSLSSPDIASLRAILSKIAQGRSEAGAFEPLSTNNCC